MPQADFSLWDRGTLERFAREAADEIQQLRTDLRAALNAYRALVREQDDRERRRVG